MLNRYRRIGRTSEPRWMAGTGKVSEFSAENLFTETHSPPDDETVPGLGALTRTSPSFGRDFFDKVPRSWVVALVAILFVYLFTSGAPRLFDQIDGQYAGAAREMMARGDWLVPTQNGVPRLQKPPLVYWCEALSMSALGVNEFGARFPVALATIGWFLATGLIARRVVGTWTAGVAGALILSMFTGTFFFTHLVMPEPFLGCFMALSFWSLLKAVQVEEIPDRKSEVDRWLMLAWGFVALSVLTKGIHGLLIPVAAFSCTARLRPSIRGIWRRFILRPKGWILLLAILAPWYLAIECRYPGFLKDHFFNEQIGSALSRRWPPDSDRVPLWIFWPEHLVLLFPISLFFPAAIRASLQREKNRQPWLNEEALLLLSWFLVVALGISFANIQDYYLMIAWTPIAIWISWVIVRNVISYKWPAVVVGSLGASGLGVALWVPLSRGSSPSQTSNSASMIGDTILNVFQILPPTVWKEIIPLLGAVSTLAFVAGILIFMFDRKGKRELCLAGFALLMAAVFAIGARGMQVVEDEFSSAKVAEVIDARGGLQSVVIAQSDPNISTTLFFYLHRPVYWVGGHPNIEFATRTLGIGLDYYLTREQVAKAWKGTKRVFLVIEASALAEWKAYLRLDGDQSRPIGTCGSRLILANR